MEALQFLQASLQNLTQSGQAVVIGLALMTFVLFFWASTAFIRNLIYPAVGVVYDYTRSRWAKAKAWWKRPSVRRRVQAKLKGTLLKRASREVEINIMCGDVIVDCIEELVFRDKLTGAESRRIYRRLAHALQINDLLPARWQQTLKTQIEERLVEEENYKVIPFPDAPRKKFGDNLRSKMKVAM